MNEILYDLSGKIDPSLLNALIEAKRITDGFKIEFMVIGATARDILLEHLHGIEAPRMTRDLDIAVCLPGWAEYGLLSEALLATGKFVKGSEIQRYLFGDVFIDIVPFGGIADQNNRLFLPPEHETVMSIVGFSEAFEHSVVFRLCNSPVLDIRVPSLPGLAIMKLLAWNEKYPDRRKDAEDLLFIMRQYQYAGIEDRLYGKDVRLLEEEAFDNEIAGIRLLGCDMARMSHSDTAKAAAELLTEEMKPYGRFRLINQMISNNDEFDRVQFVLGKLKQGFDDGVGRAPGSAQG